MVGPWLWDTRTCTSAVSPVLVVLALWGFRCNTPSLSALTWEMERPPIIMVQEVFINSTCEMPTKSACRILCWIDQPVFATRWAANSWSSRGLVTVKPPDGITCRLCLGVQAAELLPCVRCESWRPGSTKNCHQRKEKAQR